MGFTLRFMLGLALVLATCSLLDCASSWRHVRQTSSLEGPSEAPVSRDTATKGEDNGGNKGPNEKENLGGQSGPAEKDEIGGRKPKTDATSTEITVVNSTTNNDRGKPASGKTKIEDSLEKPAENLRKESQRVVSEKVPENTKRSAAAASSRADDARSLNIDIHKYVSPDFHNKNNVYSFSVSPGPEKYTPNMHKSTTSSRFQGQDYGYGAADHTASPEDDFDAKFQHIEDSVKQKLEYIDHHFADAEREFQRPHEGPNVTRVLEEGPRNETDVEMKYTRFKNVTSTFSKNKNAVHKDLEVESGQNIDFVSSYNKTQVLEEPPKDYKNKIPTHEGDTLAELLPDHGDVKPKLSEANQTDTNNKSLLSNKIETEAASSAENLKPKWNYPPLVTVKPSTTTTTTTTTTKKPGAGQKEHAVYVPYTKDNLINISKRGSTKFVDTITTTTEIPASSSSTKTRVRPLKNKQALASKENKTLEQAVLENQVYPVQISSPGKEEEKAEKPIAPEASTEGPTLPPKLFTMAGTSTTENQAENQTGNHETSTRGAEEVTGEAFETSVLPLVEVTSSQSAIPVSTTERLETTTSEDASTAATTESGFSPTERDESTTMLLDQGTTAVNEFTASTTATDFSEATTISGFETTTSEATTNLELNVTVLSTTENGTELKSEYEDRTSNGRELKGTSKEDNTTDLDYQTVQDHSNNLDVSPSPETTDRNLGSPTTTETITTISMPTTKTTSDYRENIIVKQSEPPPTVPTSPSSTSKKPEDSSHEAGHKSNLTDSEGEDEGEDETEDEIDQEGGDHEHTTMRTRMVRPTTSSEPPPFIVPLNVSMVEPESPTDATTIEELGSAAQDDGGGGGPIAAIVISCIGAVCLIVLAGLLFVMRKRHKRFNYGQRCTPVSLDAYSVDNVSVYNSMRRKGMMRASKRSYGNPAFEDPSSITRSLNFPALAKFAGNSEEIGREFEEIPQVTAQMNELPEGCETKNRYANVIPLPETRVFLAGIDGYPNSDYINANYVTGPKSARGYYIACQAPLQNTVDDFWRMMWEQQSKVVLMLTHLFENGTEKCVDYLPPSEVLDCHRLFGDFQVTLKKREVKEKYVISSLQLKNMVSNSWREVTHLWYLGWPEKGVPSEANSLIAFLIEARSYLKTAAPPESGRPRDSIINHSANNGATNNDQNPVIVHCSPGTGRTGTVIACDIVIREFELARQVDIPKTVYRIRRDRASSVQTKEQYAFIYKVISLYATKLTGGALDSL